MDSHEELMQEQMAYYHARASEYDEWFLRKGRYYRGEEHKAAWDAEIHRVASALKDAFQGENVLEIACGTGLWTQRLAPLCTHLTALDSSSETLRICKERVKFPHVEYVQSDVFEWRSGQTYDFVFFSFWLSHVPEELFEPFWGFVGESLKPGGRAFFVDNLFTQDSSAKDHGPISKSGIVERKLNDGREYKIVKVFYEPDRLTRKLADLGWVANVVASGRFFVYGKVEREPP